MTRTPRPWSAFFGTALLKLAIAAQALGSLTVDAVALNDTGQTTCYNAAGAIALCQISPDDGRYGRDAASSAGLLMKVGAGVAGFDFSKIANNGNQLIASVALGNNPGEWACTQDNVTGLMWEMKTASSADLRFSGHTYTWYSTAGNNAGNAGSQGADTCNGSLASYSNLCNTANYVSAVNATGLCGHNDWRLPEVHELQSLVNFGATHPAIDADYFPGTAQSGYYFSANTRAGMLDMAWGVDFSFGGHGILPKAVARTVRLVRASSQIFSSTSSASRQK